MYSTLCLSISSRLTIQDSWNLIYIKMSIMHANGLHNHFERMSACLMTNQKVKGRSKVDVEIEEVEAVWISLTFSIQTLQSLMSNLSSSKLTSMWKPKFESYKRKLNYLKFITWTTPDFHFFKSQADDEELHCNASHF